MARLEVQGITGTNLETSGLNVTDELLDAMLDAEAEVVVRAQKAKGEAYGVHQKNNGGMTLASIKPGKKHRYKGDRCIEVAPQGSRKRGGKTIRNGEIAFLNEYGVPHTGKTKKNGDPQKPIPARPFIRDANEECADEAVKAAYEVLNNHLNKKGL